MWQLCLDEVTTAFNKEYLNENSLKQKKQKQKYIDLCLVGAAGDEYGHIKGNLYPESDPFSHFGFPDVWIHWNSLDHLQQTPSESD